MSSAYKCIAATAIGILFTVTTHAQVVVRVRPAAPRVVVTKPAPRAGYYWRDGEWRVRKGVYVYSAPRYIHERPGRVWVPGHWAAAPGGEVWVPGHWN